VKRLVSQSFSKKYKNTWETFFSDAFHPDSYVKAFYNVSDYMAFHPSLFRHYFFS